ncbi:uncharacterized protein LOC127253070 [Andrographis paniculata]|uniref:uncharacterized protein LOC127253070 n=1 Tax=Andrographis paniculata TaxID=175694 RepID=UPI0021E72BD5|nr:uncharacterized protein LOC127253070 [Andrographis paniculata]
MDDNHCKSKARSLYGYDHRVGLDPQTLLIIKLPDSRALRILSRSLFFAMLLIALPSIASIIGGAWRSDSAIAAGFQILPILRDLMDEGLIKRGHRGFLLGDVEDEHLDNFPIGLILAGADANRNIAGAGDQEFDFVYIPSFGGKIEHIEGILKDGGLVISLLGADPSDDLRLPENFDVVYVRRFENTVVAMRKTRAAGGFHGVLAEKVICGGREKRKKALKGLEEVYLEPPLPQWRKKGSASRKVKFLPDLSGDPLDEYRRRIFIADETGALEWFDKNYPKKGHEFEVYDASGGDALAAMARIDVRREDFVVVKAEAQVVEEMMRGNPAALCLVDEVFLECRNGWDGDGDGDERNGRRKRKRAYWECLSLYGRVRDEGIAVHQWWHS